MLSIRDKQIEYSEILEVPAGYKRECLLATTFGLDLNVLRYLLVLSAFPRMLSIRDEEVPNELNVMNAIDSLKGKFYVICHRGQIYPSEKRNRIDVLLDHFVIEMKTTEDSCFHPKIILQVFKPGLGVDGEMVVRVTVSSRNLTMPKQTHLELQFTAEGYVEKKNNKFSEALADHLKMMFDKAQVQNDKILSKLLEYCSRTKFNFSDDVGEESVEWFLKGPSEQLMSDGPKPRIGNDNIIHGNSFIMSPFINTTILEAFQPKYLITSQYALTDIKLVRALQCLKAKGVLEECLVCGTPENDDEELTGNPEEEVSSDLTSEMDSIEALHAKMLAYDHKDSVKMVMGSSNFTRKGMMTGNWEANLSFRLKKVKNIKDLFLAVTQFEIKDPKSGKKISQLWPFFTPANLNVEAKTDDEKQNLDNLIKGYLKYLFQVRHKVKYTISILNGRISLYLTEDLSAINAELSFRLFTDDGREFIKEADRYSLQEDSTNSWSRFIKIDVFSTKYKSGKVQIYHFTICAECREEDVRSRDEKLSQDIINSRDTFVSYALNALSAIESSAVMRARALTKLSRKGVEQENYSICRIIGVENIIRTLAADPGSYIIFDRLAEKNSKLEESVQDKEFIKFWEKCKKALQGSRLKVDIHD